MATPVHLLPNGESRPMRTVYLLTAGEGCDGDAWEVLGVYSTRERAEAARGEYLDRHESPWPNPVEEWPLDALAGEVG